MSFVNRPADDIFRGRVMSPNPQCIENRVVRVFRVAPGADPVIDFDRSEDNGTWSIDVEAPGAAPGTYYARTPARTVGANTCAADRSPNVTVAR